MNKWDEARGFFSFFFFAFGGGGGGGGINEMKQMDTPFPKSSFEILLTSL